MEGAIVEKGLYRLGRCVVLCSIGLPTRADYLLAKFLREKRKEGPIRARKQESGL